MRLPPCIYKDKTPRIRPHAKSNFCTRVLPLPANSAGPLKMFSFKAMPKEAFHFVEVFVDVDSRMPADSCKLLKRWSGGRGSNPRRPAWEAGILPLNYPRF